MTQSSYSSEAMKHMIESADGRVSKIEKHIEQAGGKLLSLHFTLGEYNAVSIYEMPDEVSTLSLLAAVQAKGFITKMKTTELFSPEDAADAFKKARQIEISTPKG